MKTISKIFTRIAQAKIERAHETINDVEKAALSQEQIDALFDLLIH